MAEKSEPLDLTTDELICGYVDALPDLDVETAAHVLGGSGDFEDDVCAFLAEQPPLTAAGQTDPDDAQENPE